LDSNYTPVTQYKVNLFTEKQKFLYGALETKVLTDRGKAVIRDHEDDFNAQKVYRKLKAHNLTSTKAMIESSTILVQKNLEMARGMDQPKSSSRTGRTKSGYARNMFPLVIISLKVKRRSCFKMLF
jgi:hypothetical protein